MENKMILVKGDVSGIQDFIFNVKSDGAARELKGRSFFIKLLNEVAIAYILDKYNITKEEDISNSKISTSGGNFILKLPSSNKDDYLIKDAQSAFDKALQFTGLNISFALVQATDVYKVDIEELNRKCRAKKYKYFTSDFSYFQPFPKTKTNLSEEWKTFTDIIKTHNAFTIEKSTNTEGILSFHNSIVAFAGFDITFNKVLKGLKLSEYLESLFPIYNNSIIQFECLSKTSEYYTSIPWGNHDKCKPIEACSLMENGGNKGIEKLGILAMDVDGLGLHLTNIENQKQHSEIDEKLRTFFNEKIAEIINNENDTYNFNQKLHQNNDCHLKEFRKQIPRYKNKIYSVTAGGDDSFFVGKWNTILDFAFTIHKEFNDVFKEEKLTISAGIIIVDPKFPVVRFADLVENALRKAKYGYETKGNICLLGEVIPWDLIKEILEMRRLLRNSKITGGMLAKARLTATQIQNYDKIKLSDFWRLGYFLRDLDDDTKDEILEKIEKYISLSISSTNKLRKYAFRSILPISARLAEFDKR